MFEMLDRTRRLNTNKHLSLQLFHLKGEQFYTLLTTWHAVSVKIHGAYSEDDNEGLIFQIDIVKGR